MSQSLGVAVIGAGMAGKAHADAYRSAATVYGPGLPTVRTVAIADINETLGRSVAARFGYERWESDWRSVVEADDVDVVSIVVANALHREILEAALAAGKHVLCEKPLADTLEDAQAMAAAGREVRGRGLISSVGFLYRRSPGLAAIRDYINNGVLGPVRHLTGRYMCDYACNPQGPMSWRFAGPMGSGALGDVGSHLGYIAEFLAGEMVSVSGGRLVRVIHERPKPLGAVVGHAEVAVSDEMEPVTNDDYAAWTADFAGGAAGVLEVSRVAAGYPNGLEVEVFCENGSARWNQLRPDEIGLYLHQGDAGQRGYRTVYLDNTHPYITDGLPMDGGGVGYGQNNYFTWQARAFLEEVAGIPVEKSLPRCADLEQGVHAMQIQEAVAASATSGGAAVQVPALP